MVGSCHDGKRLVTIILIIIGLGWCNMGAEYKYKLSLSLSSSSSASSSSLVCDGVMWVWNTTRFLGSLKSAWVKPAFWTQTSSSSFLHNHSCYHRHTSRKIKIIQTFTGTTGGNDLRYIHTWTTLPSPSPSPTSPSSFHSASPLSPWWASSLLVAWSVERTGWRILNISLKTPSIDGAAYDDHKWYFHHHHHHYHHHQHHPHQQLHRLHHCRWRDLRGGREGRDDEFWSIAAIRRSDAPVVHVIGRMRRRWWRCSGTWWS